MSLFVLFSLLTVCFSFAPVDSLWSARDLLIFLVVPVVVHNIRGQFELRAMFTAMGLGAAFTTIWGTIEVLLGRGGGENGVRLAGTLGHYMTAGGILMFVAVALFAAALYEKSRNWRFFYFGLAVLSSGGVALTHSRNAYVGLFIAIIFMLLLWRKQLLLLLPFALSLLILLAPPMIRDRIFHIVDLEDQSVMNRINMLQTGAHMVADYPLFGVGMQQVQVYYNRFKPEDDPGNVPHLHNNIMQIAAERGVPSLIIWLWMLLVLGLGHLRLYRRPNSPPWYSAAALAAFVVLIAMFSAGMFEYNFGDDEVLMAFLLLVSIPFGLRRRNSLERGK